MAGILPYAYNNGELYFLISRENKSIKFKDSGFWSDFGGGKEKNESKLETAIRECYEETSGFLGTIEQIRKNIDKQNNISITANNSTYETFLLKIVYDSNLPLYMNRNYKFIQKHLPNEITKRNGLFEKDRFLWIHSDSLEEYLPNFRRFYRAIIKKLISYLNNHKLN